MRTFIADYKALHMGVNDLSQKCRQVEIIIYDLAEVAADLDIFWSGEANDAYITRVNRDLIMANTTVTEVIEIVRSLAKALEEYQENEKVVNRLAGGMKK